MDTVTVFQEVPTLGDLPPGGFVNVEDAAAILGVTGETIRRWIANGKLIAQKDSTTYGRQGWRWVIAVAELEPLRIRVPHIAY